MPASTFIQMMYSIRNIFIYFSIFLSVPSSIIYCSQMYTIIWHKQFHNAFYALFVAHAIIYLISLINSFYGYRLPCIIGEWIQPLYVQLPGWSISLYFFFNYYNFHAENLVVNFILLNRLSAISLPVRHERLWQRYLPLALFIIFVIPICFSFFLFNMDATIFVFKNDPGDWNGTSLLFIENSTHYLWDNSIVCAISAILMFTSSIFINATIFMAYKMRGKSLKKQQQNNHNQQNGDGRIINGGRGAAMDSMETKLLVYGIITFFCHLLSSLFLLGIYICTLTNDFLTMSVLIAQAPWIADLGGIVTPSWMLFWADSNFRQQWCKDFVPKVLILIGRKLMTKNNKQITNLINVNVLPYNYGGRSSMNRGPTISNVFNQQRTWIH